MATYTSAYTGAQIDAAVAQTATNKTDIATLKSEIGQVAVGNNLLDNSYFGTGVINQRGATSYATNGYTIDRWRIESGCSLTVNTDSITFTTTAYNCFIQDLSTSIPSGTSATISVNIVEYDESADWRIILSDASDSTVGRFAISGDVGLKSANITTTGIAKYLKVYSIGSGSITMKAVKLELGSKSTLSSDYRPNVELEKVRCQSSTADSSDTYANGMLVKVMTVTLPSSETWGYYTVADVNAVINVVVNARSQYLNAIKQYEWGRYGQTTIIIKPTTSDLYSATAYIYYI